MVNEGVSSFRCQVRGENLLSAGKLDQAVLEFKKVVEMKPNIDNHMNLGNVYQRQKKYQLAIDQYEIVLKWIL